MLHSVVLSRCPKKHSHRCVARICHNFFKMPIGGTRVIAMVTAFKVAQPLEITDKGV